MTDLQQQVQDFVDAAVDAGSENGVQVAVYRHGRLEVDVVSGLADPAADIPVTPDTLFFSASTGKAVASTVAHVLVEYGPEFGAHGKESATLRHVLTHSVGVPALPRDITVEKLCDWQWMTALVADAEPWWTPGERVGYHAGTFGYILGEVVRRATGKRISQVLAEEVAGPLGVAGELWFGMPASEHHRLARLEDEPGAAELAAQMMASMPPDLPMFRSAPPELFPSAEFGNRPDTLAADIPAGGKTSARAIARMYAALLGEV